jgi:hypothetical protein
MELMEVEPLVDFPVVEQGLSPVQTVHKHPHCGFLNDQQ